MSEPVRPQSSVRRAGPADVDAILDLLTEYDLPREEFAPFYLDDPTYRPDQSWLAVEDGHLVAHVRVFDRWMRAGGARLRVAGVGNVITARAYRGRGHAGAVLQAMLAALQGEGYAYSLLWTHVPGLYARYGWAPIEQVTIRATLPAVDRGALRLAPFAWADLPDVARLYDATNAHRTGPLVRSRADWQSQVRRLHPTPAGFLVARTDEGALAGYIRTRAAAAPPEILELGLGAGRDDVGRALLAAAAGPGGRLVGMLPPSQWTLFHPPEREIVGQPGLMGRTIDPRALVAALAPVWTERLRAAGASGTLALATGTGPVGVQVGAGGAALVDLGPAPVAPPLSEADLGHLLLHGADATTRQALATRPDWPLLAALFPPQDFVIWQADGF